MGFNSGFKGLISQFADLYDLELQYEVRMRDARSWRQ